MLETIKHITNKLRPKAARQTIYTVDWFSNNIDNWSKWLSVYKDKPGVCALEIGSFEGRSTCWLLDNILTHDSAHIICIDIFEARQENIEDKRDMASVKKIFLHNIKPYRKKVSVHINSSQAAIRDNPKIFHEDAIDFIYIDGSHRACDVLEDIVLCFRLLKKGGVIIFDDYEWERYKEPTLTPKLAIDAWMACFEGQYEVVDRGYQLCIKKTVSSS